MNALKYLFTLATVVLVMTACKNETTPETKTVDLGAEATEKTLNPDAEYIAAKFEIDGMMCAMGCAKVIEKNLAQMDGVRSVEVDFESKTAKIEYDEAMVNPDLVMASVNKTGDAYAVTSWNGEQLNALEENIEK
jgi:periplasmic mercuric ion binding protein